MRIYRGIMHIIKIIFKNLGNLVLKIQIDLGSEFLHHAIRIFRDFYDSEVRFSKKLFYYLFF